MSDPVEAAIKDALLAPLISFAASASIPLALPNVFFDQPTPGRSVKWLRATILPADSFALAIAWDATVQHYGLMQVDVFHGEGAGEIAPARIAAQVIALYARGTVMQNSGFNVAIIGAPTLRRAIKDEPWLMLPVIVPYQCFADPA